MPRTFCVDCEYYPGEDVPECSQEYSTDCVFESRGSAVPEDPCRRFRRKIDDRHRIN